MIADDEIRRIVMETANLYFKPAQVIRVEVEPDVNSFGDEVLQVTIVTDCPVDRDGLGDGFVDTLVRIRQRLVKVGEPRFPLIDVVTEEELSEPFEDEDEGEGEGNS
ncbi:MAG: hypothetical protein WCF85_14765 [Rhodospirillaceae bacterium]